MKPGVLFSLAALCLAGCSNGTPANTPPVSCGVICNPTPATPTVYVMQTSGTSPTSNSTIYGFSSTDSGSASPSATLPLSTGFQPFAIATAQSGNLYIVGSLAQATGPATPEVLIYQYPSGQGVMPVAVVAPLSGPLTQLTGAESIATDSTGQIYVLTTTGTVNVYAANASGNVAPIRTFNVTSMATGTGITVDSVGNVYIGAFIDSMVQVYGPNATGNATPIHVINGSSTQLGHIFQLAVDSNNNLYVGTSTNSGNVGQAIVEFAYGANGNDAPSRSITGSSTGFNALTGIALDSHNTIYEADAANFGNLTGPSLNIFSATATGNATPTAHITSSSWTTTDEGSTLAVF